MLKSAALLLLAITTTSASTIYRISFEGTFGSNAIAGTLQNDGRFVSQSIAGLQLRGSIDIELSLLPAPAPNSSQEIAFEAPPNAPVYLTRANFSVDNLPPFPNSDLFNPGPYDLTPIPIPSNATNLNVPEFSQQFAVIESLNFFRIGLTSRNTWSNPEFVSFSRDLIWALNAQGLPAIPYNPTSGQFVPFNGVPSFSTGFVQFLDSRVTRGTTPSENRFSESTQVAGSFTASSVTGEIITPEPATLWLSAAALCLLYLKSRR